MNRIHQIAAAVTDSGVFYRFEDDLPKPNIYFTSVFPFTGEPRHTYIAADFTGAALAKSRTWCKERFNFMPMRSNCNLKFRRMKLGDILENPEAFAKAYDNAKAAGERDIVQRMDEQMTWIVDHLGVGQYLVVDAAKAAKVLSRSDALWARMADALEGAHLLG